MTNQEFDSCMQRMAAGDRQALREVYDAYLAYVFAVIAGVVKNRDDAQDLAADLFVKLYLGAASYRPGGGHRGYLAAMARNLAIDHLRRTGREWSLTQMEEDAQEGGGREELCGSSRSAEDEVMERMSLREAVESLPGPARQIVAMKVLGQMTFREIAQILEIPMGTVTWRYQDSMKRLRRSLG